MVVIATGINGASAQFPVVEGSGLAAGHVITRNHSMAEKAAQLSDPHWKQKNAVPLNVPVSAYLILCKCKKRIIVIFQRKTEELSSTRCEVLELQSSNFATADTCDEKGFTSRYTLLFSAVELFSTNILICLFQSCAYCVYQNWKKISSVLEALDLKVFVVCLGIIRIYMS